MLVFPARVGDMLRVVENSIRVQVCLSNCTRIMDAPRNPYTCGRLHYDPYKAVVAGPQNVIHFGFSERTVLYGTASEAYHAA